MDAHLVIAARRRRCNHALATLAAASARGAMTSLQAKQRDRADVCAMLAGQTLLLRLPHQRGFLPLDVEQIALHLGFGFAGALHATMRQRRRSRRRFQHRAA